MDVTTKLIELYGDKIEGLLGNGIAPYYYETLKKSDATEREYLYAVCFFDSFLDFCTDDVS